MVYQWKINGLHKTAAQTAGEVCERLNAEGRLTPTDLVEDSRPDDAPLHSEFEWNDDVAAEHWRMHQARNIINAIVVVNEAPEPTQVRAFFQVTSPSRYESVQTIIRRPDMYDTLLRRALSELSAFKDKYKQIKELNAVFAEIEKATKENK